MLCCHCCCCSADGAPRNVQPGLGPPKPAVRRSPAAAGMGGSPGFLLGRAGMAHSPAAWLPAQPQMPRQQLPAQLSTPSTAAAAADEQQIPSGYQPETERAAAAAAAAAGAGMARGGAGGEHAHSNGVQQAVGQQQVAHAGEAAGAAAAGGAEAAAAAAGTRIVGAPVTTPGVVKTRAGKRGALGPLLNRLRAEAAAEASK